MTKRLSEFARTVALFLALAVCAPAQDAQDKSPVVPNPIKWSVKTESTKPVKIGEPFTLELTAKIEAGWHLYSLEEIELGPKPTRISLAPNQPFEFTDVIDAPAPQTKFDSNFGINTEFYEDSVTFSVPVKATPKAGAGKQKVTLQVRYQTCNDKLCLPPKLLKFETPVEITDAGEHPENFGAQ